MKYLKISNKGEVPKEAFTLVGASTKRGDSSKIGMFGSGNKFAIAYLLRNDHELLIYSGDELIKVETIDKPFGDMVFKVVRIGGIETSITTEMGPQWTLWQAVREFYSNAIDEGLVQFEMVEDIEHEPGVTSIYVSDSETIQTFMSEFQRYFSTDTPFLYKNKDGAILKKVGRGVNIFRMGIRCNEDSNDTPSIFDYDFNKLSINESRILYSTNNAAEKALRLMIECDSVIVVRQFLEHIHKDANSFEFTEYLGYFSTLGEIPEFSSAWDEVLDKMYVCPHSLGGWVKKDVQPHTYFLPSKLYHRVISKFGKEKSALSMNGKGRIKYNIITPDEMQSDTIKKSLEFFKVCNYPIDDKILVAEFYVNEDKETPNSERVMGLAEDETIFISKRAFDEGVFYVANVIFEEHIHLKHDCRDETRHMQNCLIKEMLTYMKKANSINL